MRRPLKSGVLIAVALVLLGAVTAAVCFLKSKGQRTDLGNRASEQFGEALNRAGIQTQSEASK